MKNRSSWVIFSFLFFILLGVLFTNSHLDKFFVLKANHYLKQNKVVLAQKYFEKAFELGLEDSSSRNAYVNSIINSPLTLEAQEKLVKFLENSKEDSARLKVEYFLYDLRREIYRKYPENYITNAVFNQKIMRWAKMPITYSFENSNDVPDFFIKEIENAFIEWEKVSEHCFMFEEDLENPNIIINFEKDNPAKDNGHKFVVAYTSPNLNLDKLNNMEITFYLKDNLGNYFSPNQVYSTALHEIFHALGFMGHSNNKESLMYLSKDSVSVRNDYREDITEADINTANLLYKIKPQITDDEVYGAEYIPYLVLGNEKEVNSKKIKEAQFYIKKAPHLPAGYIDLAEAYVAEKEYPKAIKALEKALLLADNKDITGIIYFNLAVTFFHIDHLEIAKDYLQKSIEIEDSEEKHYLLGEINVREGHYSEAIKEYSGLVKQSPNNIEYTIALTNIYVVNREFFKAREVLKAFIKSNPSERTNPRLNSYGILKSFL